MYNPKSCNALEKPFYTPIEAALRWCNLISHEVAILTTAGDEVVPSVSAFPQWPCLRANAEKLVDAMYNGDLQYGRDGRTFCPGAQVAKHRRTVRHADLKAWMAKYYPDQKPAFLFDEIERTTHASITVEALRRRWVRSSVRRVGTHSNACRQQVRTLLREPSANQSGGVLLKVMVASRWFPLWFTPKSGVLIGNLALG